jgi:hypothetical protein
MSADLIERLTNPDHPEYRSCEQNFTRKERAEIKKFCRDAFVKFGLEWPDKIFDYQVLLSTVCGALRGSQGCREMLDACYHPNHKVREAIRAKYQKAAEDERMAYYKCHPEELELEIRYKRASAALDCGDCKEEDIEAIYEYWNQPDLRALMHELTEVLGLKKRLQQ